MFTAALEKISFFREDGSCVIGLKRPASITLLAYDLCVVSSFTVSRPLIHFQGLSMFSLPLYSCGLCTGPPSVVLEFVELPCALYGEIQDVHNRRLLTFMRRAAAVALTTSCVNILVLTLMRGKQLGWLCLGSCGIDVRVRSVSIVQDH